MATNQEIYDQIVAHIKGSGYSYSNWYVGIASSPRERLFTDHNVPETNGYWIYRNAGSSANARIIEDAIIKNLAGIKGGSGGGDATTKYVYAYHITSTTLE